jgi:hypothetical protein
MTYKTTPIVSSSRLTGGKFCLLARDASGKWVNAARLNSTGTVQFVLGAYRPGMAIGTYGVNPGNKTAWAVLDYNGEFAVGRAD